MPSPPPSLEASGLLLVVAAVMPFLGDRAPVLGACAELSAPGAARAAAV